MQELIYILAWIFLTMILLGTCHDFSKILAISLFLDNLPWVLHDHGRSWMIMTRSCMIFGGSWMILGKMLNLGACFWQFLAHRYSWDGALKFDSTIHSLKALGFCLFISFNCWLVLILIKQANVFITSVTKVDVRRSS